MTVTVITDTNKLSTPLSAPVRPAPGPGLSQLRAANKGTKVTPEHFCTNCRMKRHNPCGCQSKKSRSTQEPQS